MSTSKYLSFHYCFVPLFIINTYIDVKDLSAHTLYYLLFKILRSKMMGAKNRLQPATNFYWLGSAVCLRSDKAALPD
jgi:hypothetical protein